MYTIGFTTKFYTLWDVTVEHFTNAYGRKGERVTANYIKNISMDEQAARVQELAEQMGGKKTTPNLI